MCQLAIAEELHHEGESPMRPPHPYDLSELDSRIAQRGESVQPEDCPFGPLFTEVRVFYGVYQKTVAEKAEYHLRNMLEVEKGVRESDVMTAIGQLRKILDTL